jgi:regulator of PEP synthase PpsR (kinase-PPPase family)
MEAVHDDDDITPELPGNCPLPESLPAAVKNSTSLKLTPEKPSLIANTRYTSTKENHPPARSMQKNIKVPNCISRYRNLQSIDLSNESMEELLAPTFKSNKGVKRHLVVPEPSLTDTYPFDNKTVTY